MLEKSVRTGAKDTFNTSSLMNSVGSSANWSFLILRHYYI